MSEGRDRGVLAALVDSCSEVLLDVHSDPHHHRSVLTLGGSEEAVEAGARSLAASAVSWLDLTAHRGRHPRMGVLDVVPFVPFKREGLSRVEPGSFPAERDRPAGGADDRSRPAATSAPRLTDSPALERAVAARDRFARWLGQEMGVPCFLYGPLPGGGQRSLPEVRRLAFSALAPESGERRPHPTAGACAVGARHLMVAYNVWLTGADMDQAASVAAALRGPSVRSLAFDLGGRLQVSCNLLEPFVVGPQEVHDRISSIAKRHGARTGGGELVGLLPGAVLDRIPADRWADLGLEADAAIESRLASRDVSWR